MFVFAPPAQTVIPVWGREKDLFPVRRIFCVARNYADHAKELGEKNQAPTFFCKPTDAAFYIADKELGEVPYPSATRQLDYEVELAIAIGKGGRDIAVEEARSHVWGWAVAIDFTRRDLHNQAKAAKGPWDSAKGFDFSAPIGSIRPVDKTIDPSETDLWLYVNNERRQHGNSRDMIFNCDELISEISKLWTLQPGDIILSGTPSGVGPVEPGDVIEAGVNGVGTIKFKMV